VTLSERHRYLQRIQDEMTREASAALIGRRLEVLVDQVEEGAAVARSYREAPEIDGVITINEGSPGDWLEVEIVSAFGTEMEGKVVAEATSLTTARIR